MALVLFGCGTPSSKPSDDPNPGNKPSESSTATKTPSPKPKVLRLAGTYAGEWSEPVDGLSARLLVTLTKSTNSAALFATPVILEVKNTYTTPLAFIDQPLFTNQAIQDAEGNALPKSSYPGNQLTGEPQWAVIPGNTYLGIRVDTSIPVEVGLYFGLIAPEAQSLTATLVAKHREGPKNQWTGEIQLSPVSLTSKGTGP